MLALALVFGVAYAVTLALTPLMIPRLKAAKILGRDMNKPGRPRVAEMGGLAVVAGFASGVLASIALATFTPLPLPPVQVILLLAALATILLMSLVGVFDDLLSVPQYVKAVLPLFAALPLVAVKAGVHHMTIPFLGAVNFGILYALILVPVGIAGASNVTNMFAGFNGMEAGQGVIACLGLAYIALHLGSFEALIILLAMAGALVAFLPYSWTPTRIFIGDVGTLSVGAVIASSVIIGNYETAGVVTLGVYILDFALKAARGFPSKGWWGKPAGGKLYCEGKPVHLAQVLMKLYGGVSERKLVLTVYGMQLFFSLAAIALIL